MKLASAQLRGLWSITPRGRDIVNAATRADLPSFTGSAPQAAPPAGPIAVIPLAGVLTKYALPDPRLDEWLGFCPTRSAMAVLAKAANDPAVRQIALLIDSPGGLVAGSNELAEMVARVSKSKPINAVVSDCCCSAALLIASQCRTITANASAEIGSIGTMAVLVDTSEADAKAGYKFITISSGGIKGAGADGKVTPELIEQYQEIVDAHAAYFKAAIVTGRRMTPAAVDAIANGRFWLADEAKRLGLIDAVAAAEVTIGGLSAKAMPRTVQTKASTKQPSLLELLKLDANSGTGR